MDRNPGMRLSRGRKTTAGLDSPRLVSMVRAPYFRITRKAETTAPRMGHGSGLKINLCSSVYGDIQADQKLQADQSFEGRLSGEGITVVETARQTRHGHALVCVTASSHTTITLGYRVPGNLTFRTKVTLSARPCRS